MKVKKKHIKKFKIYIAIRNLKIKFNIINKLEDTF